MSNDPRNIWLVRTTDRDISGVEKYGGLPEPIFEPHVSPMDVCSQERHIRECVLPYATARDLVLTVGPQVMLSVLSALMMEKFGELHLLTWERKAGYIEKCIGANSTILKRS